MNKSASVRRLVALLIWIAILIWALYSSLLGDWGLLLGMTIGGLIGISILVVFYIFAVKRMLLTVFSSYSHSPTPPDQFPQMDVPGIERLTAEWEALGFVQRGDSEGRSSNPKLGVVFSRLFEREDAVVEVVQHFTPTKALAPSSMVVSFWGQREQIENHAWNIEQNIINTPPLAAPTSTPSPNQKPPGDNLDTWVLTTHNRAPNRYYRVMNHPRAIGARLETDATPTQIWEFHKARLEMVTARLDSTPVLGDLPDLLRAHGRVLTTILVRRIRATPAYKLALYSLNRKPGPAIYDGELAPLEQ